MLGANLGIGDSLYVMDGNDACNRWGIDTISAGAALSFACELTQRGWSPWPDTFTAPMDFGSFKAGDEVPWDFGIPELPPLALACMAMVEPVLIRCFRFWQPVLTLRVFGLKKTLAIRLQRLRHIAKVWICQHGILVEKEGMPLLT